MKGPKLEFAGGTTFDFKMVHFLALNWCLLGGPVLSQSNHLLQLRCSNVEAHQRHTKTPRWQ